MALVTISRAAFSLDEGSFPIEDRAWRKLPACATSPEVPIHPFSVVRGVMDDSCDNKVAQTGSLRYFTFFVACSGTWPIPSKIRESMLNVHAARFQTEEVP